jgi:hypothetical protein
MAGDSLGEGAFAGAIGAHDGMDFALPDREGDALDDGFLADGDMKVLDFEEAH